MCEVCAVFGVGAHWSDAASHIGEAEAEVARGILGHRHERRRRLALLGRLLARAGLAVSDWDGESYCIEDALGRRRIVADLSTLWHGAEQMSGVPLDPLADDFFPKDARWSASYRESN